MQYSFFQYNTLRRTLIYGAIPLIQIASSVDSQSQVVPDSQETLSADDLEQTLTASEGSQCTISAQETDYSITVPTTQPKKRKTISFEPPSKKLKIGVDPQVRMK